VDPVDRTGLRLLASDDHDAWLLSWPPGTSVTPHDHGDSTGVFTVVQGELIELRRRRDLKWRPRVVRARQVVQVPAGTVHDVRANTQTLSVHVYSPPLTSMSFYDDLGIRPLRRTAIEGDDAAIGMTRVLRPAPPR
jgi:mannose-6-phosphate isomerase-like protein (cupin superfamily)